MKQTLFDKLVQFAGENFELFACVFIVLFMGTMTIFIGLKLREIPLGKFFHYWIRTFLYKSIVFGLILVGALMVYTYWENYEHVAPELQSIEDVLPMTQWVKDEIDIYFIDENVLYSVPLNGGDTREVFKGSAPVKEYYFSPDGEYLLVLTENDLFLVNIKTKECDLVETIGGDISQRAYLSSNIEFYGAISGIAWAKDSQKFVYELARWSKFSSQDIVKVYDLKTRMKRAVKSPTRKISSLYWDKQSENLYYLYHEAQDTSESVSKYEVKVFRISLETLRPEFVTQISSQESSVPIENLRIRDIDLFLEGGKISFALKEKYLDFEIEEDGLVLNIDKADHLYLINEKKSRHFRKRLFKIPREAAYPDKYHYDYKGGDLVIGQMRWIPGGRYVIMEHRYLGVLVLDPRTKQVGLLIEANGKAFGWYRDIRGGNET